MLFYPKDFFSRIEWPDLLEYAKKYAYSSMCAERVLAIRPFEKYKYAKESLDYLEEIVDTLRRGDKLPISRYEDIRPSLRYLEVENYTLEQEDVVAVRNLLEIMEAFMKWFTPPVRKRLPLWWERLEQLDYQSHLLKRLNEVFDDKGEVRPDASPELLRISQDILAQEHAIHQEFKRQVSKFKAKGWLSDSEESTRNNRRVLSVQASHKRQLGGIVHDESASGKTTFIEPQEMVPLNNQLFNLQLSYKREIFRILQELTGLLGQYKPSLLAYFNYCFDIDFQHAKAMLAQDMAANRPHFNKESKVEWEKAYHPVLLLKNKAEKKETIPFTVSLEGDQRILMISGPNAGGKSITLKTIMLLQLMAQAGFYIPAQPNTILKWFKKFFVDIGDQQSLADELSTYSSHLKNMEAILRQGDQHSLIALDEYGAGTDPQMGGAIAESILHQLVRKGIWGGITTHYSNLKIYAMKSKAILNAHMVFDKENLQPTYKLRAGKPGSSYAFEIAEQVGLPRRIIGQAQKNAGKSNRALEDLLTDLEAKQKKYEDSLKDIAKREKELDRLSTSYKKLSEELSYRKKKFRVEQKEKELALKHKLEKEFEKEMKLLKSQQSLDAARKQKEQYKAKKENVRSDIEALKEEMWTYEAAPASFYEELSVGDQVRIKESGTMGEVLRIDGEKVVIAAGILQFEVKKKALLPVADHIKVRRQPSVRLDIENRLERAKEKVDIRGYRKLDAEKLLTHFLDDALMANLPGVQILHGKGNGVLKKVIANMLKSIPEVEEYYHPPSDEGGDGITIVKFS